MNKLKKNLLSILLVMLAVPGMGACGSDNKEVENPAKPKEEVKVSINPESLNPDYNAQTLELTVTANVDWSIKTEAPWITLRPAGGVKNEATVVKVTCEANKEFDTRNANINIISGSTIIKSVPVVQGYPMTAYVSNDNLILGGEDGRGSFTVTSNSDWTLLCDADWITLTPDHGGKGDTQVSVIVSANNGDDSRMAEITLSCGNSTTPIKVMQLNYNVVAPEGYTLVWNDEFDGEGTPGSDWIIENQSAGWVNNELQTYTSRQVDGKYTLEVKDGLLHINCFKGSDGKIYSGRMNAKPSTGWQYGYVEARINLPSGKGTWPAFWMMPSNVDWNKDPWPYCGEIDIMEEVGVVPNEVSSSIHTGNYNHTIGTQKTHAMTIEGAEGNFHIYAMEWDEEKLITYVDGEVQLSVKKSVLGSDHASWPFDRPFYPILNLAWGGNWGGMQGVNENALPVTMLVDYVRIFQKQ